MAEASAMKGARLPRSGLIAALLALATQIAWGAVVPPLALATVDLSVICHSNGTKGEHPPAPRHRPTDHALCVVCQGLAMPAPTLSGVPPLPAPRPLLVADGVVLPPPTAPPSAAPLAAKPRGPPSLA